MKTLVKIILLLCIIPSSLNSISLSKSQRIYFYAPDSITETSIQGTIYKAFENSLRDLENSKEIFFFKTEDMKKDVSVSSTSKIEDFYNLFLETDITGIIYLDFNISGDYVTSNLVFYKIIENEISTYQYEIPVNYNIFDISNLINKIKLNVRNNFPPTTAGILKKRLGSIRNFVRNNSDFDLEMSGGAGFYLRQSLGQNIYSAGFTPYTNLNGKFGFLSLKYHIEASPIFTNYEDNQTILYNLLTNIDLGGWINGEIYRIGFGFGFLMNNYNIYDWNKNFIINKYYYTLIYMNNTFKPVNNLSFSIDFGLLIDSVLISRTFSNGNVPIYFNINFKIYYYKNAFFEFYFPFFLQTAHYGDNNSTAINMAFNLGFGYKIDWRNK